MGLDPIYTFHDKANEQNQVSHYKRLSLVNALDFLYTIFLQISKYCLTFREGKQVRKQHSNVTAKTIKTQAVKQMTEESLCFFY